MCASKKACDICVYMCVYIYIYTYIYIYICVCIYIYIYIYICIYRGDHRPVEALQSRLGADAGASDVYTNFSVARKDFEAVLGVWCPASQPPWRSPLGWGALWPLA